MATTAAVWLVLILALVAANLPFANERLFVVGPLRAPKGLGWRVLELVLLCALTLGIGFGLEARIGQIQPQGWEFYADRRLPVRRLRLSRLRLALPSAWPMNMEIA